MGQYGGVVEVNIAGHVIDRGPARVRGAFVFKVDR